MAMRGRPGPVARRSAPGPFQGPGPALQANAKWQGRISPGSYSGPLWTYNFLIWLYGNPKTLHFHDLGIFGRVPELQHQYHLSLESPGYFKESKKKQKQFSNISFLENSDNLIKYSKGWTFAFQHVLIRNLQIWNLAILKLWGIEALFKQGNPLYLLYFWFARQDICDRCGVVLPHAFAVLRSAGASSPQGASESTTSFGDAHAKPCCDLCLLRFLGLAFLSHPPWWGNRMLLQRIEIDEYS